MIDIIVGGSIVLALAAAATFSGIYPWVNNVANLLITSLAALGILSLYIKRPQSKTTIMTYISRLIMIYIIVIFAAYGFWLKTILAIIFWITIINMGIRYTPTKGENNEIK